jgi:3-hydroxybutyryl-CoA dehydratase
VSVGATGNAPPKLLGVGFFWDDLQAGQRFRTIRRTVTETDLVNFIGVTGMLEAIFIDTGKHGGAIGGRPVPGALTYALIEGLLVQTMVQGTGLALLELHQHIFGPVRVGDSVHGVVEVLDVRATSKGGRGVVQSRVDVYNQRDERVMTYTVSRLLAGRVAADQP